MPGIHDSKGSLHNPATEIRGCTADQKPARAILMIQGDMDPREVSEGTQGECLREELT